MPDLGPGQNLLAPFRQRLNQIGTLRMLPFMTEECLQDRKHPSPAPTLHASPRYPVSCCYRADVADQSPVPASLAGSVSSRSSATPAAGMTVSRQARPAVGMG